MGEVGQDIRESPDIRTSERTIVIGATNPSTMTREAFLVSPDLLYHGSAGPFEFNRNINYDVFSGSGSFTLGSGLYTTSDRKEATLYSKTRQNKRGVDEVPITITEFLPYQTRMLDLRSASNPTKNIPVSSDFARKWLNYFKTRYDNPQFSSALRSLYGEYLSFLLKIFRENHNPCMDLRVLLRGLYSEENVAPEFRRFMLGQGYDGLIYVEGGDSVEAKACSSYVFYNLEKVGTYDIWHQPKQNGAN